MLINISLFFIKTLDDGSGWTLVNKAGIIGIVPTSYIRRIISDSSQSTLYSHGNQHASHDHGFGTALYAYTKNSCDELSVLAGDTIKILREGMLFLYFIEGLIKISCTYDIDDGSGWVKVTKNGDEGLVPAAYVIRIN